MTNKIQSIPEGFVDTIFKVADDFVFEMNAIQLREIIKQDRQRSIAEIKKLREANDLKLRQSQLAPIKVQEAMANMDSGYRKALSDMAEILQDKGEYE